MVRFKVIKGSHLLLGFAVAVLVLVIGMLIIRFTFSEKTSPIDARASLVQDIENKNSEAETDTVFASLSIKPDMLELDPGEEDLLDIEIISTDPSPDVTAADKPSVLIYHTHTHEAYEQVASDRYVAIEAWRTNDQDHSVVRVGQELAQLLRSRGFQVTHDTTDHEQNELSTAYTRSLKTLESYDEAFDLYIDLHRDAYIEGVDYEQIDDGEQTLAQLMLLIGNGEGFDVKPYYAENLAFAKELTSRINEILPGLCRDVLVKDGRYNQNIGVFSILVEVGHNRNTLREALNALPYLADGIRSLMIESPVEELSKAQESFIASRH